MRNRRKITGVAVLCAICLFTLLRQVEVKAEQVTAFTYTYSGEKQVFESPYTGIYQVELYGAQGSNAACEGGKGGKVTVSLCIKKGEKLSVYVGGQNGYNGGGGGRVSNGGGATDIRKEGERIAIAGGGGGGTNALEGGAGGSNENGDYEVLYEGGGNLDVEGSAGGGSGYKGGSAGYYYIEVIQHNHKPGCYEQCYGRIVWADANGDGLSIGACDICHKQYEDRNQKPGMHPESIQCGVQNIICGKSTDPVRNVYSKRAMGGSNWYDAQNCGNAVSEAGVQSGDGLCCIKLLSMHNLYFSGVEGLNVYYNGCKVKRVYYKGNLVYFE